MLERVTFTGVDQKTKVKELEALQEKYPFVEFGVLISENNTNKNISNRYPSLVMLKGMKNVKNLSLHVCGRFVRAIMNGDDWSCVKELMGDYWDMFSRIQLNAAGYEKFTDLVMFPKDKQIIIQMKSDKTRFYDAYKHVENVLGFQDNSGGTGIFKNEWIIPDESVFGFAGGINVDNVVEVVETIDSQYDGAYWIDMESSVRTNDKFDVKKCEEVCKILVEKGLVKGY